MASANNLVDLFSAITHNLQQDRQHINQLDSGDGDTGDNMAANFQLVTDTLSQFVQQAGPHADIGAALQQAAQVLQQQGHGATAPIYAQGLSDAAQRLQGKTGFTIDDLLPLLQGLLQGAQQASGTRQGDGSLLDVLLPGILTYLQAKQAGASDTQAILNALLSLRRGANSTATSPKGYGKAAGSDTTGRIDPGAAGAASLLEGLFGALLNSALQRGTGSAPQQNPLGSLSDLFGSQPTQPSLPPTHRV